MLEARIHKKLWHFTLDLEFTVGNDEILVLWGPSGAGKTTTLECLAGLRNPGQGCIRLDGQLLYSDGEKVNLPARLRSIGYLFQDYALFPHMTVKQNVCYGLESDKGKSNSVPVDYQTLLDSFGILHLLDRYPGQLSGGEQQRVALARALVCRPRLLLLDEPFSSLDRASRSRLRQELLRLHQQWQIPMVLVTHDEEDAELLGHKILPLRAGPDCLDNCPAGSLPRMVARS